MKTFKVITATMLAAFAVGAQASLLSISGGADYPTSSENEFFAGPPALFPNYNIGGDVYAEDNIFVTYTRIGSESGWDQTFFVDSLPAIQKSAGSGKAWSTVSSGNPLDFAFQATKNNGDLVTVENGENTGPLEPSFATVFDVEYEGVFYDALLMFDDTGAENDDNHDDFVIGVNARVPEPSILLLMGLGLIGLFGARGRKA